MLEYKGCNAATFERLVQNQEGATLRAWISKFALLGIMAIAVTGCGDSNTASDSSEQGTAIDVMAALKKSGFSDNTIGLVIEKNAAYWLRPFNTSVAPGGTASCVLVMTNETYKTGKPYSAHAIHSNSKVRLEPRKIAADGTPGAFIEADTLIVPFKDVTPKFLVAKFKDKSYCDGKNVLS